MILWCASLSATITISITITVFSVGYLGYLIFNKARSFLSEIIRQERLRIINQDEGIYMDD